MKTGALVLALVAVLVACSTAPSPPSTPRVTALVGGRVLPSPQAAAIPDGVVLIEGTTITAVGSRATLRAPEGATVVDCTGGTLTSRFWNSHVHFTGSQFRGAETTDERDERARSAERRTLPSSPRSGSLTNSYVRGRLYFVSYVATLAL